MTEPARADSASTSAPAGPVAGEEAPVLIVDSSQRCVEVNESASRMLGLERSEIVGRSVDSLNLPEGHLLVLPRIEDSSGIDSLPVRRPRRAQNPEKKLPSRREREVLALLARGSTDAQVAAELELSPATVQTHVRNAKAKLGARTRAQAVALALVSGLIDF